MQETTSKVREGWFADTGADIAKYCDAVKKQQENWVGSLVKRSAGSIGHLADPRRISTGVRPTSSISIACMHACMAADAFKGLRTSVADHCLADIGGYRADIGGYHGKMSYRGQRGFGTTPYGPHMSPDGGHMGPI